jgi:hypothetical protein
MTGTQTAMPATMARGNPAQLALAFGGHEQTRDVTAHIAMRALRTRTRTMPSRDSRGRFVSFSTTAAPSWYVFCAAEYRIPGETPSADILPVFPAAPQRLPRAIARWRRRISGTRLSRADWLTYLVFAVSYVALAWYAFHLPPPHR